MRNDHHAFAAHVRAQRRDEALMQCRRAALDLRRRGPVGDRAAEVAHLGHERVAAHPHAHDLGVRAVHHPHHDLASRDEVLEQRRPLVEQRLDLGQRDRLHAHQRGLLAARRAHRF